jgi:hypothetical protein
MHEQHAGRAADSPGAMTPAADIVGEEHFPAAAPVLFPVARFNFERAGKHNKKLAPGGRVPVLVQAFGHLGYHRALRRQCRGAAAGMAPCVVGRIVDREIDLDKLRPAIGCRSEADDFHQHSPNGAPDGAGVAIPIPPSQSQGRPK